MEVRDYYQLLGVEREATDQEIKRAYRQLVMAYHPDRNRNDRNCEERLKEIHEAYQVLDNKGKRRQYDAVYSRPCGNHTFYERDLNDELREILREFLRGDVPGRGRGRCRGGFRKGGANAGCGVFERHGGAMNEKGILPKIGT